MKPVAYLVLAHVDPAQLLRLCCALNDGVSRVYIHLDAKVDAAPFHALPFPDCVVWVEPRIKVSWAAFSQVAAILTMMRTALGSEVKFSHLVALSGLDYPIRPVHHLVQHLNAHPEHQFMRYVDASDTPYRIYFAYYWWLERGPSWLPNWLDRAFRHGVGRLGRMAICKRQPEGLRVFWGSAYWALTPDAARYVLEYTDAYPEYVHWARSSFAVDEHFFHTLIGNSPFAIQADGVQPWTGRHTWKLASLHHIDVSMRKIFELPDYTALMASGKYFARKFTSGASESLIQKLRDTPHCPGESLRYSLIVVLSCHNRRVKTETCLASLYGQVATCKRIGQFSVCLTDDGSTDGTGAMLAERFPEVQVIRGDGNQFWAGGMRLAYGAALAREPDFCLWLNDDVELFPGCLDRLLDTYERTLVEHGREGVVVGSTCNSAGEFSYGGMLRQGSPWHWRYPRIPPGETPKACDTFNGNCVLIPRSAQVAAGNMDPVYRHGMGDMDYGLRLRAAGVPLVILPGFVGRCAHDHRIEGSYLDWTLPLRVRWRKLISDKGLPPLAWMTYCRRHTGYLWPLFWIWPYSKVIATSCLNWWTKRFPERTEP